MTNYADLIDEAAEAIMNGTGIRCKTIAGRRYLLVATAPERVLRLSESAVGVLFFVLADIDAIAMSRVSKEFFA